MVKLKARSHSYGNLFCHVVLFGIQKQPEIGFLSLMEHLRYCEVLQ